MFVASAVCFVWDTKPDFPSIGPWLAKLSEQATIGLACKRMRRNVWKNVINARGTRTFNVSLEKR